MLLSSYVLRVTLLLKKTKQQLTKLQHKQNACLTYRLTYATPKIISICMEVETLLPNEPNNFDLIATALTILKQKKIKCYKPYFKKL